MTTNTVKHTPGPLDGSHCQQVPCTISGFYHIVEVGKDRPAIAYVCNKGDAHLYAAAPDLFEACKALLADCEEYSRINNLHNDDGKPATNHSMRMALAAISKAEAR